MFAQVDSEGNMYSIVKEISDHRMTDAALKRGVTIRTYWSGTTRETPRKMTAGWELLVEWKDGSSSWEKLKDLKASNPIEVVEYAMANWLVDEPAFKWWVPYVLWKSDKFVSRTGSITTILLEKGLALWLSWQILRRQQDNPPATTIRTMIM